MEPKDYLNHAGYGPGTNISLASVAGLLADYSKSIQESLTISNTQRDCYQKELRNLKALDEHTFRYLIIEWEHQKPRVKALGIQTEGATREQSINAVIAIAESQVKLNNELSAVLQKDAEVIQGYSRELDLMIKSKEMWYKSYMRSEQQRSELSEALKKKEERIKELEALLSNSQEETRVKSLEIVMLENILKDKE